jgi:hypothetical protein
VRLLCSDIIPHPGVSLSGSSSGVKWLLRVIDLMFYFLFQVCSPVRIRSDLRKFSKKGFHGCRHTFITNLVGKYMDMSLTRMISGHRSDSFEVYLHIYERVAEEAASRGDGKRKRFKLAS